MSSGVVDLEELEEYDFLRRLLPRLDFLDLCRRDLLRLPDLERELLEDDESSSEVPPGKMFLPIAM